MLEAYQLYLVGLLTTKLAGLQSKTPRDPDAMKTATSSSEDIRDIVNTYLFASQSNKKLNI